jgi:polyisoprenoid-binding protein YceI
MTIPTLSLTRRFIQTGLVCLALLTFVPAALAEPAEYVIDPNHFSAGFLVHHLGYAKVLGLFRKAGGSFNFDESTGVLSAVKVVITTDSVFTNQKKRDEHLRSADFLNSAEFPEMTFTADSAQRRGERDFVIEGQLTLLGKSLPLTLTATWNKSDTYPFNPSGLFGSNPYVMGVSARGSFKRSAYGMAYGVDNGWVGDEVELILEFEAQRQ